MAWTPLPGWNWTIVGEVDKTVLLADVTSMRDRFLLAGVVLSALFAMLFVFIIRRWLTRPLARCDWSGQNSMPQAICAPLCQPPVRMRWVS
ncbi:Uncharacterised protein [Leclercia adecarboxylata]|nr:Uncharacterised protein [Leclercia adecarboxylata]